MRLAVGTTGATGAISGIRLLEALRMLGVEAHLVLSRRSRARSRWSRLLGSGRP
jgi:flavin prenyltransferase